MWPWQPWAQIPTGQSHSLLPQKQERQQGYLALGLSLSPPSGWPWLLARCPLESKKPQGGLGCPLWVGVLRSGWPATEFNNSNSESKRFHPSCLWAEEERKEEGEEGVEGAG